MAGRAWLSTQEDYDRLEILEETAENGITTIKARFGKLNLTMCCGTPSDQAFAECRRTLADIWDRMQAEGKTNSKHPQGAA